MPRSARSRIGAHVLVARGLVNGGLAYAEQIGAEALQVFVSNPRGWAKSPGDPAQEERFRAACADRSMPVFVHAPYLVNFGSPTELTRTRSAESVRHSLERGRRIGARGVVVHSGSAVDIGALDASLAAMRELVLPLLDELDDDDPMLLVEPTAGGGQPLAATVDDLGPLFAALEQHPRLGVCLDTCHAFAAGHDLASPGGVRKMLSRLVRVVGRDRVQLVHANDSKDALGSGRDRHANLGKGHIGADAFAELFHHPATRGVPVVIETSGDITAHTADLALLRDLRDR